MYAEMPVCRARTWALCHASSLPPVRLLITPLMSTKRGMIVQA